MLLSIVGTIGATALVTLSEPATCSCKLAILRPKDIGAGYLATYLSSKFGQLRIQQLTRGAVQQGLILEDADQILVPRFGAFEDSVEALVADASRHRSAALDSMSQAEALVLTSLGLTDWRPVEALSYTSSSAAARSAERLDAQYFQPAKSETITRLRAMPGGLLSDSFDVIRELVDPRGSPSARCRNYDLTDALEPVLDSSKAPVVFADMDSQKVALKDGDLAVSRLRAYLKEIAVVRVTDDIPSVGSSEFYVLRRKSEAPEFSAEALMIYLLSPPVQTILKWCQDGSQHPRFSEHDLMRIPLPEQVIKLNSSVTAQVSDALKSRAESLRLLGVARRAVEIAVEESRAAASTFISASR